jgi:ABC-type glycerol-3-phosphate transport system substrate-binding protein
LVLALVALVCISACGGGNSTPTAPSATNAASVTLSAFTATVQGAPGARVMQAMAQHFEQCEGVDISAPMLRVARGCRYWVVKG